MKAIQVQKPGGPEALTLVDLPVPKAKPNEAVVKIAAAGVNFVDVYFREGRYPSPLPFVDGQEAGGTVSEIGSDVKALKVGDHVAYTGVMGAYAEYAAVPADRCCVNQHCVALLHRIDGVKQIVRGHALEHGRALSASLRLSGEEGRHSAGSRSSGRHG